MTKIAVSGSIIQRHGSADPDPYQNVMDPQHCLVPLWESVFAYFSQDKMIKLNGEGKMRPDVVSLMSSAQVRSFIFSFSSSVLALDLALPKTRGSGIIPA